MTGTNSEGHIPPADRFPSLAEYTAEEWLLEYKSYLNQGMFYRAIGLRGNFFANKKVTFEQWEAVDREIGKKIALADGIMDILLSYFDASPHLQTRATFARLVLNYVIGEGRVEVGKNINLRKWVAKKLKEEKIRQIGSRKPSE